ncbi:ArsR/SmtB family transcription factor [Pseudalkalibacillus sp. Hm43]|uniref:ArsR/SmtB family transcription factor n=1 Tax=Pseudalkalibacillus sp. Hm43 TaxID=3450742 RepID=UPI003F42A521
MEKILSALAEHNRLKIIELLREQHLTVGEIAEQLDLRQPQVSKHLKVLSEAGLVAVFPVGNKRIYQLRGEPFKQLDRWLASYRDIQDARFDRLDAYLKELQRNDENHGSEQ